MSKYTELENVRRYLKGVHEVAGHLIKVLEDAKGGPPLSGEVVFTDLEGDERTVEIVVTDITEREEE